MFVRSVVFAALVLVATPALAEKPDPPVRETRPGTQIQYVAPPAPKRISDAEYREQRALHCFGKHANELTQRELLKLFSCKSSHEQHEGEFSTIK